MALWKNLIVLYGGFHDVGVRTTYLSDLWLWDTTDYRWHEVVIRDTDRRPTARSGFSFLPCPEGVILHGGYCKEYQGKQVIGVALNDTWLLRMDSDTSKLKWERRKKVGYAPSVRSGVQMAYWPAKSIGVSFGGVFDNYDVQEDEIASTFYNELFGYQTAGQGRWISMNLKRPKKKITVKRSKMKKEPQPQHHERVDEDEASHYEEKGDSDESDKENDHQIPEEQHHSASPAKQTKNAREHVAEEEDPDDPIKTIPIARYNAMMAVQKNILYIYGGIVESQSREFTLDDFYSLVSTVRLVRVRHPK